MKKTLIMLFAAAALTMASCSSKDATATTENEATPTEQPSAATTEAPVSADGSVVELTDAAQLAPGVKVDQLYVVDFNAVWCGPCRQLAPVLEEMAKKYAGKATFVSVDVDKFGQLMDDYQLGQSIPVVLFIHPDGTTEHYVGTADLLPAEKFEALIEKNL